MLKCSCTIKKSFQKLSSKRKVSMMRTPFQSWCLKIKKEGKITPVHACQNQRLFQHNIYIENINDQQTGIYLQQNIKFRIELKNIFKILDINFWELNHYL